MLVLLIEAPRNETHAIVEEALKILGRQDPRLSPGASARQVPLGPIHASTKRRLAAVCSDLTRQLCMDAARSHGEKSETSN